MKIPFRSLMISCTLNEPELGSRLSPAEASDRKSRRCSGGVYVVSQFEDLSLLRLLYLYGGCKNAAVFCCCCATKKTWLEIRPVPAVAFPASLRGTAELKTPSPCSPVALGFPSSCSAERSTDAQPRAAAGLRGSGLLESRVFAALE